MKHHFLDSLQRRYLLSLITMSAAVVGILLGSVRTAAEPNSPREQQLHDFTKTLVTRYGFDRDEVTNILQDITLDQKVLQLMAPPSSAVSEPPSWQDYRSTHVTPLRVAQGREFFKKHKSVLAHAEQTYGVPAEVITAILGIETNYGSYTGNFSTLRSLYTLAFAHPTRSEEFRDHLVGLFLLSRKQGADIRSYRGSYAGAVGLPQFMPSSWMRYAVDFDNDGRVDLVNSYDDAIGSIAAYLKSFGWVPQELIAMRIDSLDDSRAGPYTSMNAGLQPSLSVEQLRRLGVTLGNQALPGQPASLIALQSPDLPTEYWLAYNNFYVITRYNQSSFYAMSVFQLAEAISR